MANKQQQLATQKQISSHMNKNHSAQIPSFREYKDASSSFSMLKNLTDKPQQLTQSPSSSAWKDAADAFEMLINMTNRRQEPYSSEVPSPRRLTADSEVWLLPKKPKPPSNDQPFLKHQTANSKVWPGTSKTTMQAPTKNPYQWRAPPTSGEDQTGCGGSRLNQFLGHEPSSSKQPLPKRPTPESEAWLRLRKPIVQAPTEHPNQHYATPTSGEDRGACSGGSLSHQSFKFEPSSSKQPFSKRPTPNFEVLQGPRKPEPKPLSSEQPFPRRPTGNSEAWQRAKNPVPVPSQTPNLRRETPPRNLQPISNSRPTNNFPNPNSTPSNTYPPKFNPGVKRKAPATDLNYHPAPQPSIDHITNIIKRRSVDDYFCELCQVNSSSASTLRQHLKGRKHRNNAKYCRDKNTCREGVRGIHTSGMTLRCDVCHISCTDRRSLTMHLKGKKHMERLQKVEHGEEGVQKAIRCELCMANCMNENCFREHVRGKQHAVQLELASRRVI